MDLQFNDTKVFIVIDEVKCKVLEYFTSWGERIPLKFEAEEDAKFFAAEVLDLYSVFEVNFTHHFYHHMPNIRKDPKHKHNNRWIVKKGSDEFKIRPPYGY